MLKLGKGVSNMQSFLMQTPKAEAHVGQGATIILWTDRYAGTVIGVTPKTVTVQEDKAIRTDTNGMSESQSYSYERNPNGRIYVFRMTKNGWKSKEGVGLSLGHRSAYHDYSF